MTARSKSEYFSSESRTSARLNRLTSQELVRAAHRERNLMLRTALARLAYRISLAFTSCPKPVRVGEHD